MDLLIALQSKGCDDKESENMFEKNERRGRKSIERSTEDAVEGPEGCCQHDEKWSDIHGMK